jgi:hypothetical protein
VELCGARDAEPVSLAGPAQRHLHLANPIDAVRRHPGERYPGIDRPLDHLDREVRREPDVLRDMGRRPTVRITGPALGQVETPVDEGVALGGHIGGEDADLAIGDLAGRAGVLPSDAARRLALLQKAGLVDGQHRVPLGQRLKSIVAHNVAQRLGIPVAQHRLLTPGADIASRLRPHPARRSGPSRVSRKAAAEATTLGGPINQLSLAFRSSASSRRSSMATPLIASSPKSWSTGERPQRCNCNASVQP